MGDASVSDRRIFHAARNSKNRYDGLSRLGATIETASTRWLGLLPKAVNPKYVFDQMEKLSISKASLEKEITELGNTNQNKNVVTVDDFNLFKQAIKDLLENESSPEIKSQIIQKVVDRIIVKSDSIEIYFFVGESHYKKEISIHSQQGAGASLSPSEKRHTNPLPVFHGNPKTSEFLNLKPSETNTDANYFYEAGSNSLKNGSQFHSLPEHLQVHKKIELSSFHPQIISETFAQLYDKGLSLSDISKQTGKSKSVIRENLIANS